MSWTANATVVSVDVGNVVLVAGYYDVSSDGDDNATSVTVILSGPEASHLKVGDKVKVTADC